MDKEYTQRLTFKGHPIIIRYRPLGRWQKPNYEGLQVPVEVKMAANEVTDRQVLETIFTAIEDDLLFIIREYLSTVKTTYFGILFKYQFVNRAIKLSEQGGMAYYRAELRWEYKY
ncbi:Hypothetical protein I595_1837 [Croceitalea dokdonensis DOKDO 023]|uniref:Uncharacterized protein n=1 Tax=Croceitalea dokdonensis DOKDO 023 TaxID=1300341 RepID=A0A0N8H425_9FLAO|nr:hypothetical protein [Croceitalea dokdonensis]KPM32188.1 Hypothetical protein I595_1837 [Croceitalea dokdonensis DOKDO 023]